MWHVATADAASVAPAHALHSSQDIRYISRFHTGNPIGTWLCSISKLTILNFSFHLFFILFSIFYFDFSNSLNFSNLFAHFKKNCMFVKYFIWFSYVFLSFLFCFSFLFCLENLKKKFNARCQFCLWFFFVFGKCFAGTEHDDARRLADGVSTSRFSILGRVRAESPRTRNARHELTKRNASSRWGCRCGHS